MIRQNNTTHIVAGMVHKKGFYRSLKPLRGTLLLKGGRKSIVKAAAILVEGGLVAFPTETVYGLGAAVNKDRAIAKIFSVKGRPADNPLIVHLSARKQLDLVVSYVSPMAELLMDCFWPGPLTLVLPRSPLIPQEISAGLPTVAVRMPAHPLALALIRTAGVPVVAPSANLSGGPSPTTAGHVLADLAGKIDAVLDGGPCAVGVESTVLTLAGERPVILRPGGISREQLEKVLGITLGGDSRYAEQAPSSPGMKYRHYSPRGSLLLVTGPPERRRRLIRSLARYYRERGDSVALLNPNSSQGSSRSGLVCKKDLARRLFSRLRRYDRQDIKIILAEEVSEEGIGLAIMNRLRKAAVRIIRA